ncbi:MAG: hypothetical protein ACREQ5_18145, partial [Candidatus Dormibacteria bacterium]
LPLSSIKRAALPAGSVLCGIDSIFADGFEPASFTSTAQMSGGVASPGLTQDITAPLTSVAITSPTGSTGDPTVDVIGTFAGPVNTGVTVNGVVGYTANGHFLVPNVPLSAGSNTLSVTATTLTGATATASGSITQSGSPSPLVMQVNYPVGYAPFFVSFTFAIGPLPSGKPVQAVAINFKGSGPNDFTGSSLAGAPAGYTYPQPGFYTASFSVTDTGSNTYTTYRSVVIQDIPTQRGMLCDVYGYLQDRLAHQDATNASNAFSLDHRLDYVNLFNVLGSNMPTVGQQLGVIATGQLGGTFADLLLVRDNPDQTRSGFPLRMTMGADGVWRISEM